MLERYSERARRVLFFARYELSALGGETIEPAHVLLGLSGDNGIQRLFANWNIPLAEMRLHIEQHVPRGRKVPPSVEVPFGRAMQRVLNLTIEEADRLLHYRVEPEHLLLGLLRENDPVAAARLLAYGMALDGTREYLATQPPAELREPKTDAVQPANPIVVATIERLRELVGELAQRESNSAAGRALVERIDDELMTLRRLLE